MATKKVTPRRARGRTVMAIGDSGLPERVQAREVVEVAAIPVDDEGRVLPATIRALAREPGQYTPTRLLKIDRPNARKNRPYPVVTWACAPFVRYTEGAVKHMGEENSCYVRNESDARDPLFASLTAKERARILGAALASQGETA